MMLRENARNSGEVISFDYWMKLDYIDKLEVLLKNPWCVEGLHYSASLLASYLLHYRPAQICEVNVATHHDTTRDIKEVFDHVYDFDLNFIAHFMMMLGYELDATSGMATWRMRHEDDM